MNSSGTSYVKNSKSNTHRALFSGLRGELTEVAEPNEAFWPSCDTFFLLEPDMPYAATHLSSIEAPSRTDIDQLPGPTLLEFGTSWCSHCQAAQPALQSALAPRAAVRHLKIEDGPGQLLGRSFGVKLWPTLVFLRDGHEVDRLVRPADETTIIQALNRLVAAALHKPS